MKENLAEDQILQTALIRKPTGAKSWGMLPIYEDFLEGYIRGGVLGSNAQALQGILVKVQDAKGKEIPEFSPGITDNDGIYKIRFSLPVHWDRVDFTGRLAVSGEWKILTPQPSFRLYFNRRNGVLSYSLKEAWLLTAPGEPSPTKTISKPLSRQSENRSEKVPSSSLPAEKKKSEDLFGNFGFGP